MKNQLKMSLDMLEVESFVSTTEMELSEVKGGTTPVVTSSAPCAAAAAAVITAAVNVYNAVSNSTPAAAPAPTQQNNNYGSGTQIVNNGSMSNGSSVPPGYQLDSINSNTGMWYVSPM